MPPDAKREPAGSRSNLTRQGSTGSTIHELVPAAWCDNLTEGGRQLPESWRVGGPERRFVICSIVNLIREDVVRYGAELVDIGADPMDAAFEMGGYWRELVDDAICEAMMGVPT